MCRFVLYLGPSIHIATLVTEPRHSLIHQSYHAKEREEPLNGDGFGVGWYADGVNDPAVFRDVTPAWNNANLLEVARVTTSRCILAHVRAASPGLPVTQLNCHPFAADGLLFVHNGYVAGFPELVRPLRAGLSDEVWRSVRGSTDSEHVFALLRDRLDAGARHDLSALAGAMRAAIIEVERLRRDAGISTSSMLNLALTDGTRAVVSRYVSEADDEPNSLYVHAGRRYVCHDGVCQMVDPDCAEGAVIVASEPLSGDQGWDRVPRNHLVLIDNGVVRLEAV